MIVAARWRWLPRWKWPSSGDLPAVAPEGIHELNRSFDQRGRLINFFDGFAAVGLRDHDPITSAALVLDLVAQLLAIAVEKPDHIPKITTNGSAIGARSSGWVAAVRLLSFVSDRVHEYGGTD